MKSRVLMAIAFAVRVLAMVSTAAAQTVSVTATPALYPAFDESVTDYVTRCAAGTPVNLDVTAGPGTEVDVDRQGPRTGTFTASVALNTGQGFEVVATEGANTATYHVRCLPASFPTWTFQRSAEPSVEWFTVDSARERRRISAWATWPSSTATASRSGGRKLPSGSPTSTCSGTAT